MNDKQMIESLERKGCTVALTEQVKYVIQANGQWGYQTFVIATANLEIFHGAYTMAFNMMMKRHQQFVAMMQGKDVG